MLLFDDFVGTRKQSPRQGKPERFVGPGIDDKLILCRRLNWEIGWRFAFQDAVDVTLTCTEEGVDGIIRK